MNKHQWVQTDEKTNISTLYTKENGMIKAEPITTEEAAQWVSENGF